MMNDGEFIYLYFISYSRMLPRGSKEDLQIDENITYSLIDQTFSKSLTIINRSNQYYSYKIKTNQKTVISMVSTHDFIKPNTTKEIKIILADKPSESNQLKLEINYVIPTEEQLRTNDSKMIAYQKEELFKKVIVIKRDDKKAQVPSKKVEEKTALKQSVKSQVISPAVSKSLQISKSTDNFTVMIEKSQEINIKQFIEVPTSSQQALNVYQKPSIDIIETSTKVQTQESQYFQQNNQQSDSPVYKSLQKSTKAQENAGGESKLRQWSDLNEKIIYQQNIIKQLQRELSSQISKQSVYPFHILILIVMLSFLIGSLFNSICF